MLWFDVACLLPFLLLLRVSDLQLGFDVSYIRQRLMKIYTSKMLTYVFQTLNLHYTGSITPKRVTSSEAHLRGLATGQHSSEKTSQRWRAVGNTAPI